MAAVFAFPTAMTTRRRSLGIGPASFLTPDPRARHKRWALVEKALERLTPREKQILNDRRLGEKPKTLEELGEVFGVSRERIRQIVGKALNKITKTVHAVAERRGLLGESGWESAAEKAAA